MGTGDRFLGGRPLGDVLVPAALRRFLARDSITPVWHNQAGGVAFEGRIGAERVFAKWAPAGSGLDLAAEAERLDWAVRYVVVPEVLHHFADELGEYLITRALPGENAVSPRWRDDPAVAVTVTASGLRRFHDALPVESCPFSWSVDERIVVAKERADATRAAELDALASQQPSVGGLVVCHGDPCVPNTLIGSDGRLAGYVDLGALGVADRWADVAIGAWSTEWNYGEGWVNVYYENYGIEPDEERIAFYRELWELT